jgi:peptide/nickel transport system substrate-binding protein
MLRRNLMAATLGLPALSLARPALAQPTSARTLRFVPQVGLTFLDPVFNIAAVTNNHAFYVFDMLYALDSQSRARPQMAEGHTVSDDGLTWDIRLREGLIFHDGEKVRAIDCIASLRRWAVKDPFGQLLAATVEEWLAPDDRTLRLRLKKPFPLLPDALAKPYASPAVIMPERLAKTDPGTQVTEMVGSGPLRFVASEFDSGSRVVYARFDAYRPRQEAPDWFAGGKQVHFDRIEWRIIPDDATAAAALQSGEVDWWERVQPDMVALLQRNRDIRLQAGDPTGTIPMLRFNSLVAPFDRPAMRHAILSAVKQQDYLAAMMGGDASSTRSCLSMFPCGTPYGDMQVPSVMSDNPDLAKSRAAIAAAGYAGEKIVILNPGDYPALAALGEVTFDLFKRLGLNVELATSDWGSLMKRRASQDPVEKGGWSLYHTSWASLAIASPATNSTIRGLGKAGWAGWYESAPMEAAFQQWLAAPDTAGRDAAARLMQEIALRDAPSIPLGQIFPRTAFRKDIAGIMEAPAPLPWPVRRA